MNGKATQSRKIDTALLSEVCASLLVGRRTSFALPYNGRLQFERQLPFLFVYRDPVGKTDPETRCLIESEAAFLAVSANAGQKKRNSILVHELVRTLSREFGGFLIFEIWAGNEVKENAAVDPEAVRPVFEVFADSRHDDESMEKVYESLRQGLRRVRTMGKVAEVQTRYQKKIAPPGMAQMLSPAKMRQLNCHVIGLSIQPIWRDLQLGESFPLLLRSLHRQVSKAVRRACFTFTIEKTKHRPKHYFALGKQVVSRHMWSIDRKLAGIGSSFDFLLNVTPINSLESWRTFRRDRYDKRPVFHYRPFKVDPDELKRQLYSIDISRVEDPTIERIFREKQRELDRQLSMLSDRNTAAFKYGSMQLYGRVEDSLVASAEDLLEVFNGRRSDDTSSGSSSVESLQTAAESEIRNIQKQLPQMNSTVKVTSEVVGLMVSRGNLLLNDSLRVPAGRVRPLIAHEVEVHILTYWNAMSQPMKLLAQGLAGYDEFQEGLAVLSEYLVGGLTPSRMRLLAARVIAARNLEDGASFVDCFRKLNRYYDFEERTAYQITMRVYRGGGLTKDHVYLRGLVSVMDYFRNGGQVELLFVGKIARGHVPIINELLHRKVLKPPPALPAFLNSKTARVRLGGLNQIKGLHELVTVSRKSRRPR